MLPRYAELHCKSNFSFLTGASHPEELVERAAALGYGALAITDECSLAGVVRAHLEAKTQQLHLVIGSEMRLTLPGSGGFIDGPNALVFFKGSLYVSNEGDSSGMVHSIVQINPSTGQQRLITSGGGFTVPVGI